MTKKTALNIANYQARRQMLEEIKNYLENVREMKTRKEISGEENITIGYGGIEGGIAMGSIYGKVKKIVNKSPGEILSESIEKEWRQLLTANKNRVYNENEKEASQEGSRSIH